MSQTVRVTEFVTRMQLVFHIMLSLLPQIESKDRKPGPYRSGRRAFGQHSTQTEPALEQADASFDATAKPLQFSEPAAVLMSFLSSTQPANLRNTDSTDSQPTKLVHIVGTVIAAVGGQLSGHLFENLLGLAAPKKQVGSCHWDCPAESRSEGSLQSRPGPTAGCDQTPPAYRACPSQWPGPRDRRTTRCALGWTFPGKFVLGLLNQLFS